MDPWETLASRLVHWETCPFKIIHCFLNFRKLMVVFIQNVTWYAVLPKFIFLRPLCHTLLNALDLPKTIALTSTLSSKDW